MVGAGTLLGSFYARLGLDAGDFVRGAEEAAAAVRGLGGAADAASGGEMARLARAMGRAAGQAALLAEAMESSGEWSGEAATGAMRRMGAQVEELRGGVEALGAGPAGPEHARTEALERLKLAMGEVEEAARDAGLRVTAALEDMEASGGLGLGRVRQAREAMTELAEVIYGVQRGMRAAMEAAEGAGRRIGEVTERVRGLNEAIGEGSELQGLTVGSVVMLRLVPLLDRVEAVVRAAGYDAAARPGRELSR